MVDEKKWWNYSVSHEHKYGSSHYTLISEVDLATLPYKVQQVAVTLALSLDYEPDRGDELFWREDADVSDGLVTPGVIEQAKKQVEEDET